MPCTGPDWKPLSERKYKKIELQRHIDYVKNTASLIAECNKVLGRLNNENVRHGLNISSFDLELSDHLTRELCSIFKEVKSNDEIREKVQSSQYVNQLIVWKSDHDRLDEQRKNNQNQ